MSETKKEHTLPAVLYVYEEQDGEMSYFVGGRTASELASANGPRLVGKYWLGQVDKVEFRVKKTKVSK